MAWPGSGSRGVAVRHFPRRLQVGLRPRGSRIVGDDGLAVARGLGHPHAARDDRPQDDLAEVPPDLLGHLRREPGPPVIHRQQDRKSTRLNSSHLVISYAVFCLKKKKKKQKTNEKKKYENRLKNATK